MNIVFFMIKFFKFSKISINIVKIYTILFIISIFIKPISISSEEVIQNNTTYKSNFLSFIKEIKPSEIDSIHIQLLTIDTLPHVTTVFGHSALRVFQENQNNQKDYFIDFGVYDESASFIWRFLKGEAKFFITVIPMKIAYSQWDSTGRGLYASEFIFNPEQKFKFLSNLNTLILKNEDGYFYDNFSNNCVTFIRDLVNTTLEREISLETESNKRTWRSRLIPYSDNIVWLRISEKLLLDHDTDKVRTGSELIYLPFDLLISLEDAKLVKDKKVLHNNLWRLPKIGIDILGNLTFFYLIFIILSQIPIFFKVRLEVKGIQLFCLLSGIAGIYSLPVWLFTSFPFMNETLMILVFTPFDFILLFRENLSKKFHLGYVILRILMLITALILRNTIYLQNIDTSLFFTLIFFIIYLYNLIIDNKNKSTEINEAKGIS
jgi:hypothetical protein